MPRKSKIQAGKKGGGLIMAYLNPKAIIRTHPVTHHIDPPTLLLKTRDNRVIGRINYKGLEIKLSGAAPDKISFDVYREMDGKPCPFWDELVDLKFVDDVGYGRFEVRIQKTEDISVLKR